MPLPFLEKDSSPPMEQDPQDQKKSVDEAGEAVGKLLGGAVVFAVLLLRFHAVAAKD